MEGEEPCDGGELFIYYKPTLDQGEEPCIGGELFIYYKPTLDQGEECRFIIYK
jgi:hypothetical protein